MFGTLFNQKKDPNNPNQSGDSSQLQPQDPSAAGSQDMSQRQVPPGETSGPQQSPQDGSDSSQQTSASMSVSESNNGNGQQTSVSASAQSDAGHPNPAMRTDMSALSHLDPRATQVLTHAQEETRRIKQQYIEPDQLLFGLLYDEHIYKLLEESQVDGGKISKQIQAKEIMGIYKGQPTLSQNSQQIFDQSYRDAKMRGSNFVSPEDIFINLFDSKYTTAAYLQGVGLKKEAVVEKISKSPNSNYAKRTVLEKYAMDLTEDARQGKLDPVAGRDKEIERITHILLRRTKNNPIIIGETGVGKTAIVEGLALKIVANQVPKDLSEKRIFQLDLASLVAGASHRGEFEERLKQVLNEVLGSNNHTILFIDEIHALMGTGEGEGMNAANLIKPYLARGQMQIIGATTTTEYRKHFEKDKAFERRFQPVTADEPSEENAFEMMKVTRPKYEKFHRVTIPDDALKQSIKLAKKYIGERFLPDKAIDLLDEACSEVKLRSDSGERGDHEVKKSDIERVVSGWTGIPVTKLTEDESEKLLKLEDHIHKRLVDQEEAVVAVSEAVRRGRIGLASGQRPIASFIFLGPTGVGKTELAKTLAELLFGRDDAMARLDMSEYMEKHEVAKLIGAPPGYVGYEEGGVLTEAVRKKPYSIVLMDEIEKAHPDVFNILLQLLEDGRLTDNKGNTISFKNTIVICTSNIGSSLIQQQLSKVDASVKQTTEQTNKTFAELQKLIREELTKFLRPEVLNRFDEVVIFKPLLQEHMAGIVRLTIAKTAALLKEQGFGLQITEKAVAKLAIDGYDPVYGARPLRRLVQTVIENPIALAIISKKFSTGDTIVIDYNENVNEFVFTKGGDVQTASSLTDEQFRTFLQKVATPDAIVVQSDKMTFMQLHEKVAKAGSSGNATMTAILGVTPATPAESVKKIRTELEEAKNKGDELAREILDLAGNFAQKIQLSVNLKKVLLEIINPQTITSPEKKEKFQALHDKLVKESQQSNALAGMILAVTPATPAETIDKIMDDLNQGKEQENELATEILAAVNTDIAEQAELAHQSDPTRKYKKILQQIINPLYLADPQNKAKFSVLYDKISDARQQNVPFASSILSITDITSDADIAQLKTQLETAKSQGDALAGEILDAIEGAVAQSDIKPLRDTLLLIINPIAAPTPQDRENFTSVREKLSQASQQGNQLAATLLSVTDAVTDDDLRKLKTQLEQAKTQGDQVASLILDTVAVAPQVDASQGASSQPDPLPTPQPVAEQQAQQPVNQMPQMDMQQAQQPMGYPQQSMQPQMSGNMPMQNVGMPVNQPMMNQPIMNQPIMSPQAPQYGQPVNGMGGAVESNGAAMQPDSNLR